MPFRPITIHTELCIICSATTTNACRNCGGSHCAKHMQDGTCAGCRSELWTIERRQLRLVSAAAMGIGVVAMATLTWLAPGLELALLGAFSCVAGPPLVRRGAGYFVRRRLTTRRLSPSSRPMALPPVASDNTERESDYSKRRRRNKMVVRRAPRAIFMTRGGYFYQ